MKTIKDLEAMENPNPLERGYCLALKHVLKLIDELMEALSEFKITKNPLLNKMKIDNWIVTINNRAFICWAGLHTLDLLKARIEGEK